MRRTVSALALLLFPLAVWAADTDVVARMGELTITVQEARQMKALRPDLANDPAGLERLLRQELIKRGVAREARGKQFDQRPEVSARMARAAETELVTAYVNQLARPPEDYPTPEQVKAAYEANKDALKQPPRVRLSQIYVAGTDDKSRKTAENLHRQAGRKNADFTVLARANSQHPGSAAKGGDMGWLTEAELAPAFRTAVAGLKKGEISQPVAGAEGFHILMLTERRDAEIPPLEQVKDRLSQALRLRRAQELEAAYLDGLLARSPIAVNGIALTEMLKPESTEPAQAGTGKKPDKK